MTLSRDRYGPTEHSLWSPLPDRGIQCEPLVSLIPNNGYNIDPKNCYNLKIQSLGWLCLPKVATGSPSDMEIFPPKRTTSSHRLGSTEDLAWPPITKARCPTCPPGPIDPYKSFQTEITATWVILEDKNVPLNPPQTWGF